MYTTFFVIAYITSIIIYFFTIRYFVKRDVFEAVDKFSDIVKLLILGLIPIMNIVIVAMLIFAYITTVKDLTPHMLLRKMFLVGDNENDSFKREGHR